MPDDPEFATPPNFLEVQPTAEAVLTDAQRLRLRRLDALGLNPDDLWTRVLELESDLATVRQLLSVSLEQLQAAESHRRHLNGRIAQLLTELRTLRPGSRR